MFSLFGERRGVCVCVLVGFNNELKKIYPHHRISDVYTHFYIALYASYASSTHVYRLTDNGSRARRTPQCRSGRAGGA